MKKIAAVIALSVLLLLTLASCNQNKAWVVSEVKYEDITFLEAIENSECAIIGEYTGIEEYSEYVFYYFDVVDVLYGTVRAADVSVYDLRTGMSMDSRYEAGEQYILILKEEQVVLYDEEVRHVETAGRMKFPIDGPYTMYGKEVEYPEDMTFIEYIMSLRTDAAQTMNTQEMETVYATEADEIAGESAFIGYVRINELEFVGSALTDTYVCTVTELVKGSDLNTRPDGTILMALLKDSVEIGESYLMGFNPASEHSIIYNLTTRDSVLVDSAEIEAVLDAIE